MSKQAPISELPLFASASKLDLAASRAARDTALAQVEKESLTDLLCWFLASKVGSTMTGEDIRVHSGLQAHHPNAWGASINALVRMGVLSKTGEMRQMQQVSSHARTTAVYRVL